MTKLLSPTRLHEIVFYYPSGLKLKLKPKRHFSWNWSKRLIIDLTHFFSGYLRNWCKECKEGIRSYLESQPSLSIDLLHKYLI